MAAPNASPGNASPGNASPGMTRDVPKSNRGARGEPESLADQIETIRSEIQALTSTLGDAAAQQFGQAQASAQESIRRNPLVAVGIAAALGFLYAVLRR